MIDNIAHVIELLKVCEAIDRAMSAFEADETIIFSVESAYKSYVHAKGYYQLKNSKKRVRCIYNGCNIFQLKSFLQKLLKDD
ncbi:hypothetical protein BDD43_4907 [Mucilaginibacter gracilis]|uniref:Uncharacterized protein n=1 Tax=Mucilaginibacter gracilis TaxID=423350 RepID=A0A495J887_9SPHI|nr:hypothetical protein BDD43_4907 [Mucilaginibacter gracilis]